MSDVYVQLAVFALIIFLAIDCMRRSISVYREPIIQRRERRLTRRLRKKNQPWVTVLIYGTPKSNAMQMTMRSVRKSHYGAYDVVTAYTKKSPSLSYPAAYRRSKKGKIIVCLHEGVVFDRFLLKRAVLEQNGQSKWRIKSKLSAVEPTNTLIGLIRHLIGILLQNEQTATAYTPKALRSLKEPRFLSGAGQCVLASCMTLVLILTLINGSSAVLWTIWVTFTIYLLIIIWVSSLEATSTRLQLSYLVPSALFVIPVASLFEVSARHIKAK